LSLCFYGHQEIPKSKNQEKNSRRGLRHHQFGCGGRITFGLTKLKPAAPSLDRSTAVIDKVKRGQTLMD